MADRGILIALEVPKTRLSALAPLYQETVLAGNGALAAIVAPESGPYLDLALSLQAALRDLTGQELPLLDDAQFLGAEGLPCHLLTVGHAAASALLRRLHYLGYLQNGDYQTTGHRVTSVHSPLGDGHNVLAALGATPEVAAASVEQLLAAIVQRDGQWLVPGRLQLVSPAPAAPDPEKFIAATAALQPHMIGRPEQFRQCLSWLRETGEERWARAFIATLQPYATGYIPLSFVRMSAVDFWTDPLVRDWDACEEFPFFTDEERLQVTNFLVACGQYCHDSITYQKWRILPEDHQIFNHHTFPATGLFFTAMYLRRHGYELPELDDWLDKSLRVFARAAEAGRSFDEGGAGYSWLVAQHLMRVSYAAGDLSWVRGPKLQHYADLAIMIQNNHFETVPYGDCGSYHSTGTSAAEVLLQAAEWHDDPGAKWVAEMHTHARAGVCEFTSAQPDSDLFTRHLQPVPPERHVGLFVLPLDPVIYRWMSLPRFPGYPDPPVKPNVPVDRCFDKLSLRGGWGPDDDYLLVQGFGDGQHGHPDANAISQFQARGRLFLVDNDYISRWPKQHNMVMVIRDGQHDYIPTAARLDSQLQFAGGAMTQTSLVDYNGCDWTRTLLWLSGDCVVVVDRLQAKVAGDYELRCYWRTLGDAELTDQGLHAVHDGEHFHVLELTDSERRVDAEPVPVNNADHPEYQYGSGQAKALRETQRVSLQPGESACFVNLLLPNGPTAAPRRTLAWRPDGVILVSGDSPQLTVAPGGFQIDGRGSYAFAPEERLECLGCHRETGVSAPALPADLPTAPALTGTPLPTPATCLAAGPEGSLLVGCEDGSYGLVRDGQFQAFGQAGARIGAVACGCLHGETEPSCLATAHDFTLRWHAADGRERLVVTLPPGTHMPAWGTALCLADLDGDGRLWPIVGTASWQVCAVGPDGAFRWTFDTAAHSITTLAAGDLNGDGREEVAVGTVYYCVPAITTDGERLWEDEDYNDFWNAGPIFPFVRIGDVDGDGEPEVVTVGSDTFIHCIDCRGVKKWLHSVGDDAAGLALTSQGIVAASLTGDVHLLDGQGQRRWRTPLGSPCTALAATADGLAVAIETGRVVWLDFAGQPQAAADLGAPASHLLADAAGRVWAATGDGRVMLLTDSREGKA